MTVSQSSAQVHTITEPVLAKQQQQDGGMFPIAPSLVDGNAMLLLCYR